MRSLALAAASLVLALAGLIDPATAGSQSSNSSSNCSDGRCTRVDSYVTQDGRKTRDWTRYEAWDERPQTRPAWPYRRTWRPSDD